MRTVKSIKSRHYKQRLIYSNNKNWICTPNPNRTIFEIRDAHTLKEKQTIVLDDVLFTTANVLLIEDMNCLICSRNNIIFYYDLEHRKLIKKFVTQENNSQHVNSIFYYQDKFVLSIASASHENNMLWILSKEEFMQYINTKEELQDPDFISNTRINYILNVENSIAFWKDFVFFIDSNNLYCKNIHTKQNMILAFNVNPKFLSLYKDIFIYEDCMYVTVKNTFVVKLKIEQEYNKIFLTEDNSIGFKFNKQYGHNFKAFEHKGQYYSFDKDLNKCGLKYNQIINSLSSTRNINYMDNFSDKHMYWADAKTIFILNH